MKIWGLSGRHEPFGYVVRAKDESEARRIIREHEDEHRTGYGAQWLDLQKTSCDELSSDGPTEVLITYYNEG